LITLLGRARFLGSYHAPAQGDIVPADKVSRRYTPPFLAPCLRRLLRRPTRNHPNARANGAYYTFGLGSAQPDAPEPKDRVFKQRNAELRRQRARRCARGGARNADAARQHRQYGPFRGRRFYYCIRGTGYLEGIYINGTNGNMTEGVQIWGRRTARSFWLTAVSKACVLPASTANAKTPMPIVT
jgi:hypothetical protein